MADLTHFNPAGRARMVDVSEKEATERIAIARGRVIMKAETVQLIESGKMAKGDVLAVAQVAGIMAAKRTADLVPMCHPLTLSSVNLDFECRCNGNRGQVDIEATVKTVAQTGVEMEALTAVAVAGLTIYDMCKAVDREMTVSDIRLIHKTGGKSGTYWREEAEK